MYKVKRKKITIGLKFFYYLACLCILSCSYSYCKSIAASVTSHQNK